MCAVDRNTAIKSEQIKKHTLIQEDISPSALVWQEPVIDKDLTSPPVSPSEGDRYIVKPFAWDVLDVDCSSLTGWTDNDNINGVSSQVTFDAKTCFKLDTNVPAANNRADRYRNDKDPADNYTAELNLYLDTVSADVTNGFILSVGNGVMLLYVSFRSDGLFINDGATWNEVGTNLVVQDVWQKWKFEVTGGTWDTATCKVYLDDVLKASNVDCSINVPSLGITLQLNGDTDNDRIAYVDYIKIGDGIASGDWAGQDNKITQYISSSWSYYTPQEGWFTWVKDEDKLYRYNSSSWAEFAGGLANIVEDLTPQLGGDLDLNGKNIDFPTTANISDCLDEDNMVSDSATKLITQQSAKAYVDNSIHTQNTDTALAAQSEDLDMNTHKITGIVDPVSDQQAATKKYVDDNLPTTDVTRNTLNIIQNAFNIAVEGSYSKYNMVDAAIDAFVDETGIDTGNSTNEDYDSTDDFYKPTSVAVTELDYMEYATDGATQTAYVTNAGTNIVTSWTDTIDHYVGSRANYSIRTVIPAGAISTSGNQIRVTLQTGTYEDFEAINVAIVERSGSTSAGTTTPTEILFSGSSGVYITLGTSATSDWLTFSFDETKDYLLIADVTSDTAADEIGNVATGGGGRYEASSTDSYNTSSFPNNSIIANCTAIFSKIEVNISQLQSYSESTIKEQGSYSLKASAVITDSLNDTLTRTVSPTIDLSDVDSLVFDARASRTGTNFEIQIHDSGGTTTTKTVNIASADTWQEVSWDISAVANANKDAIDSIVLKVTNADAANTIYIDDFKSVGATNNMTLISNSVEAETQPDNIRIIINEEDVDVVTLGTNFFGEVSRDDGANWVTVSLVDEGDYGTGKRILTGTGDVSAQAADKTVRWRIRSTANDNFKIHRCATVWD